MSCLESKCYCGWIGFSNDREELEQCPKCKRFLNVLSDEGHNTINFKRGVE